MLSKYGVFIIIWMYFIKTYIDFSIVVYLPKYEEQFTIYSDRAVLLK